MPDPKMPPPPETAMGFAIASIVLSASVLGAAVKRGDTTIEEARGVISRAGKFLEMQRDDSGPEQKQVFAVAAQSLAIAEQFLSLSAAEKPPQGGH